MDVVADFLAAMGGRAINVGGTWRILAAAYTAPTVTLDEDHIVSPIDVATRIGRRERFNAVKGV